MFKKILSLFATTMFVALMMATSAAHAGGEKEIAGCDNLAVVSFAKNLDLEFCMGSRWREHYRNVFESGVERVVYFDQEQRVASFDFMFAKKAPKRHTLKIWYAFRVNGFLNAHYRQHRDHPGSKLLEYKDPPVESQGWFERGTPTEVSLKSGQKVSCLFFEPKFKGNGQPNGSVLTCGLELGGHYVFFAALASRGNPSVGTLADAVGKISALGETPIPPVSSIPSGNGMIASSDKDSRPEGS
ncbi:MAG: hypothetical protein ISR99_02755 [Parcubacteria group bacterium]|nr:hypothetical protein [Parcubacteria group bacterium]